MAPVRKEKRRQPMMSQAGVDAWSKVVPNCWVAMVSTARPRR